MRGYYILPEQIVNNRFIVRCADGPEFILDVDLNTLDTLRFNELLSLAKKTRLVATRRGTKSEMISGLKQHFIIGFHPEEGERDYLVNDL